MKKNNKQITGSIVATSLATIGFISYKVLKKKYPTKVDSINKYVKDNLFNLKSFGKIEEELSSDSSENITIQDTANKIKNENNNISINNNENNMISTYEDTNNNDTVSTDYIEDCDTNKVSAHFLNCDEKTKEDIQEHLDNLISEDNQSVIMPDDYIEDEIRYQLCLSKKEIITKNVLKKLERIDFFEIDDNDLDIYCYFLNEYTNIKSIVIDALNPLKYDSKIEDSDYKHCLKNISPINNLQYLEELSFNWGIENIDFSSLTNLKNLKKLEIKFGMLSDISFISNLTGLEHLEVMVSNNVRDLTPLTNLTNLKMLYIYTNIKLDISILKGIKSLEKIYINGESVVI